MAVTYMRKLEEEPETYDSKFTALTQGVNLKVQEWVLNRIKTSQSILEVGCGTGNLASKMALKGNNVVAIDKNFQMINYAMQNYPSEVNISLIYQIGTLNEFPIEKNSKDIIVSTFMLSELRPLEQQIFLRKAWKALKPNGRLIIAAEVIPSGFWKLLFSIKRWWFKKKLRRLRLESTFLLKWFFNYLEPIGYKVKTQQSWNHGSIQAIELLKKDDRSIDEPGYYRPKLIRFKGLHSQIRIYRCLFTGQIDRVPIEPGIYQSGSPNENSPIIVTANYEYTYMKVMRDLKGLDVWILCVDSNGINVWCAARGDDFGNKQLLEAIEATGIHNLTENKTLILPQLSAGGVSIPELPKKSENFPFKILYGPLWSKDLPLYLEKKPKRKPESMKIARFSLNHRLRAGITHTTFLLRKIFLLPLIIIAILLIAINWSNKLWWIGEIFLWILITNAIIAGLFPLSNFTRKFLIKGTFFGIINIMILGGISWILHKSLLFIMWNIAFYFWIAFFSTMSFSGYTMSTNPREIQIEYVKFKLLNKIFLAISLIFLAFGLVFYT
ncbi:MAG: methyltransferase domain-containing protein [Candidatus Hermodarchaeota archaeon]